MLASGNQILLNIATKPGYNKSKVVWLLNSQKNANDHFAIATPYLTTIFYGRILFMDAF
jgi:hypothetical protein